MRIEPPISEPVASVAEPAASAAADPPDEPPAEYPGFQGLRVTPHRREWVNGAHENSGAAERAWTSPPARRIRSTTTAVWSATASRWRIEPCVHGCPATAVSSLTATGSPSSGRGRAPEPA